LWWWFRVGNGEQVKISKPESKISAPAQGISRAALVALAIVPINRQMLWHAQLAAVHFASRL